MSATHWCRLCGNSETIVKSENSPDTYKIIEKFLSISDNSLKTCDECKNFLNEINLFSIKSKNVENMFVELSNCDAELNPKNLNDIRIKFGLPAIESNISKISAAVKQEPTDYLDEKLLNTYVDIEILEETGENFNLDKSLMNLECDYNDEEDLEEMDQDDSSDFEYELNKSLKTEKQTSKTQKDYEKTEEEKLFDFICHICKKEFPKMCYLRSHCRKEHNCLPQVNCVCGKVLGTWRRLLIHKRKHFTEKVDYECLECGLSYLKQSTYEAHMNTKHGPEAKSYICTDCGRAFKEPAALKKHERTHLPDELKLTELCTICNKKFVNKNSLQKHIECVHIKPNAYTCENCGKSFSCKSNLKSHLSSHKTEKTIQCDQCDKKFKTADCLRKHKRIHADSFLSCKICGNNYRTRQNLIGHMVVHSNEKKFKCTYCPNEYKRSKDLKCHLNLHTGERPYKCTFCDRTFVNGSNCRKHKLKDHPEELAAHEAVHGKGKIQKE